MDAILKRIFSIVVYWLVSSNLIIMSSDEWHGTLLMISQHWKRWCLAPSGNNPLPELMFAQMYDRAITWTNNDYSSVNSCSIHIRETWKEMLKIFICYMSLKYIYSQYNRVTQGRMSKKNMCDHRCTYSIPIKYVSGLVILCIFMVGFTFFLEFVWFTNLYSTGSLPWHYAIVWVKWWSFGMDPKFVSLSHFLSQNKWIILS